MLRHSPATRRRIVDPDHEGLRVDWRLIVADKTVELKFKTECDYSLRIRRLSCVPLSLRRRCPSIGALPHSSSSWAADRAKGRPAVRERKGKEAITLHTYIHTYNERRTALTYGRPGMHSALSTVRLPMQTQRILSNERMAEIGAASLSTLRLQTNPQIEKVPSPLLLSNRDSALAPEPSVYILHQYDRHPCSNILSHVARRSYYFGWILAPSSGH